jgi:cobalt-zinc-cadmium efflux system outer membrane protein
MALLIVLPPKLLAQRDASSRQSLDLRAVLDSVALHHPSVLAARARARAALGTRQTAGQFGNPMLGYEVDGAPFPGQHLTGVDRETMTMLNLPLEPLYQRGPRIAVANAQVRMAEAEATASVQSMSIDAARTFYRAARAQVRFDLTRDVASWLDTVVAYNRARVNEGVAAEADLIRSQLERDRTMADLAAQHADLVRASADLSAFVNDDVDVGVARIVFSSTVFGLPALQRDSVTAVRNGIAVSDQRFLARPDVIAAQERTTAANAAIGVERANVMRQLGATIGTKQMMGATTMLAGVTLPFPIFDRNRGEITRTTAERDAAALDFKAVTRMASAQVTGARAAAELLTTQATALAASADTGFLARADESRRIALGAYREGAVPLYQVIDATRAWSDARMSYFDLVFAQQQSILDLLYATGADLRLGLKPSSTQSR